VRCKRQEAGCKTQDARCRTPTRCWLGW
jgi:hypothetical protein